MKDDRKTLVAAAVLAAAVGVYLEMSRQAKLRYTPPMGATGLPSSRAPAAPERPR